MLVFLNDDFWKMFLKDKEFYVFIFNLRSLVFNDPLPICPPQGTAFK